MLKYRILKVVDQWPLSTSRQIGERIHGPHMTQNQHATVCTAIRRLVKDNELAKRDPFSRRDSRYRGPHLSNSNV